MRSLILLLTICTVKAFSQTEEAAVKQTITSFFYSLRRSESTLMRAAFAPDAVLQTVAKIKDGNTVVHTQKVDGFIPAITCPHPEVYDERIRFDKRIRFDIIRVDADLAVAWTPYKFYIGNKFSHCGMNSFQLVRLQQGWKIQYLIDTRRKDHCP